MPVAGGTAHRGRPHPRDRRRAAAARACHRQQHRQCRDHHRQSTEHDRSRLRRYRLFGLCDSPVALAGLLVDFAVIAWLYRSHLSHVRPREDHELPAPPPEHRYHLIKSSIVAAAVLVLFAMGYPTHLVAMGGGAALLFTRRTLPQSIYAQIDWTLLVMFAGLFIVVRGVETTGLLKDLVQAAGPERLKNVAVLSVAAAALSNLVSNVPAMLLL